ncbi:MAG: hypothetical protein ACFB0G_13045 [Leptolyngbyaceae cyanobacterium]
MTELCCLRLAATTSLGQASEDIELMGGIRVSPSTIDRNLTLNSILLIAAVAIGRH